MMREPCFTMDLSTLPGHAFGHRSLTWWGVVAFMVIEGIGFAMAVAAYFFLMNHQDQWPPNPVQPPDLLAGTLFTLVLLLSEVPNSWIKKAAEREEIAPVRLGLVVMTLIGIPLFVLRGFEFASLNVSWTDNPYGSVLWMLMLLHTVHILTDWGDTATLTALMHTRHGLSGRRFADVSENSLYWRFVWLMWLPIYLLVYWIPRWVP
jgi:heme/copper-type cytochrome/quinol oxidase subunit 3